MILRFKNSHFTGSVSETPYFEYNKGSNVIELKRKLDREEKSEFKLEISACDKGRPRRYVTASPK